jgi:DNA-binding response OmpR family regulator
MSMGESTPTSTGVSRPVYPTAEHDMTGVLVVEDESNLLATLRFNLEREGYDVHTAADGEAGLTIALREKPDLVLLDLMLPKLIGTDVLQRIGDRSTNICERAIFLVTGKLEEIDVSSY